jgi:hypothetical protein
MGFSHLGRQTESEKIPDPAKFSFTAADRIIGPLLFLLRVVHARSSEEKFFDLAH